MTRGSVALAALLVSSIAGAQGGGGAPGGAPPQKAPGTAGAAPPSSGAPAGRVEERRVHSALYQRDRRVWVYTPPGYDPNAQPGYPMIVSFDGEEYLEDIPLPKTLDSLLAAGKLPAFVAVLVDNNVDRIGDLGNRAQFADFLGNELVPWVRQHWNVTQDPHRVIVTGSSAGGLASAYVAYKRPDLFGNVLSQSGAFWRGPEGSAEPYEWLAKAFAASRKLDIRFHLEVGALETRHVLGSGPVFIEAHRRFRDALLAKGYVVSYAEVQGGNHAPADWARQLPAALVSMAAGWSSGPRR
ncbi:MAG TPA: alpha/beta hydrolase-fold protein [Polyangia bacterium]|jgi:enterochelin esterase family protein|nr:alpha/beta hydrolase-fold protein [Polyangia bacterium]